MSRNLIRGLIVGVAFFHSGFLQAQSVMVPLSPRQADAFCSANDTGSVTNIDLRMPNDVHLIGTVDCSPSAMTALHRAELNSAAVTCPTLGLETSGFELTTLENKAR